MGEDRRGQMIVHALILRLGTRVCSCSNREQLVAGSKRRFKDAFVLR